MPVNSPGHVNRWQPVFRWLLGASALFYVLSRFEPCAPPENHSVIDSSWMQVLHLAFKEHWQFGRDIVFTFGPWGFLYGGYDPATHLVSVIAWTFLSVVFWWAAWQLARLCFGHELFAWLWLMLFSAVAGIIVFLNMDVRLIAWVLLLLLLHFFLENRSSAATEVSLVVSLGLLSLIKFNIFVAGVAAVLVIAADNVWRQRRFPWILPVFGASLLFFWVMAGQQLGSLVPFICNSWRITSGFTGAMSLVNATETRDVCLFLAATVMLGALAGCVAWKRHRFFGILPLVGLGFVGFMAFKYGYVRHDGHEVAATIHLLLAALACQAMMWPLARKKGRLAVASTFLPTMVILLFTSMTFSRHVEGGFLPALARTFSLRNLVAPLGLFYDRERLLEAQEENFAALRDQFPLPQIEGSVDVYPWNQAAIFAHGLRYHPRPVIQSYSAYTPELAELNAAFLRSDAAADNILFEIAPIDFNFPALEDGRSWPELLTRYDIKNINGPFLLLTRSATPRKYQKVFLKDAAVSFGKPVPLPSSSAGPIWAEIEINQSLLGAVVSALYKPPILSLTVTLRDGRQGDFRLVPGMTRSGFLLSPFIGDQKSFALLTARDGLNSLAGFEVTSATVSVANQFGATACYQTAMRLRLYRLDYPRQNIDKINGEPAVPNPAR